MAIEHDLEIIPVINKCDMASANPEEVEDEIVELLGCKREEVIRASGKTGMGVEEIPEIIYPTSPVRSSLRGTISIFNTPISSASYSFPVLKNFTLSPLRIVPFSILK